MKLSWLLLTMNRQDKTKRALEHNMSNAGHAWDELIWVDNGSSDNVREVVSQYNPTVSVLHSTNLGVAKGYNRAKLLSTGDWVFITGNDCLLPDNWLKTWVDYATALPNTGVISMYQAPLFRCPERVRGETQTCAAGDYIPAMPIGRRMIRRELLEKAGYLREDFGLYSYEDVEWAHRAERVCDENGWLYYTTPHQSIHFTDGPEEQAYRQFKTAETTQAKIDLVNDCRAKNWPYYNPYI